MKKLRAQVESPIYLAVGAIILIITAGLFYLILPRGNCDNLALQSAQEIKGAIECADKYSDYTDPNTGVACNMATVKLCQESSFSVFGIGQAQAYLGLMVPEYMIYFKQFPVGADSYPFERATSGDRPTDLKFSLTDFKQFFKTKYLENPCTDENALCMNIRGREEVVKLDINTSVQLDREGVVSANLLNAPENPNFYVIAPCYGEVTFTKGIDGRIYGRPDKLATGGASNYCFADSSTFDGQAITYAGEASCEVGMVALDFLTLGTKKIAETAAEKITVKLLKESGEAATEKITKEVLEDVTEKAAKGAILKGGVKAAARDAGQEFAEATSQTLTTRLLTEKTANEIDQFAMKEIIESSVGRTVTQEEEIAIIDGLSTAVKTEGSKAPKDVMKGVMKGVFGLTDEGAETAINRGISSWSKSYVRGISGLGFGQKATFIEQVAGRTLVRTQGIGTSKLSFGAQLSVLLFDAGCFDPDLCRAGGSCAEATLWPGGITPTELTESNFIASTKSYHTVSMVFAQTCNAYLYGGEKDPNKIIATTPEDWVKLAKIDLGKDETEDITLSDIASYLGIDNSEIGRICSLDSGVNSKTCLDSLEVREKVDSVDSCWADGISSNTYDFENVRDASSISIIASVLRDKDVCGSADIVIENSTDGTTYTRLYSEPAVFDDYNQISVQPSQGDTIKFRYIRVSETGSCLLQSTRVAIDPAYTQVTNAVCGQTYSVPYPNNYAYFILPDGFKTTASGLCKTIDKCSSVALWIPEEKSYRKYNVDLGTGIVSGDDFEIGGGDKVGIITGEVSDVEFCRAGAEVVS